MNTSDIIDKVFFAQKMRISKSDILTYLNIAQKWAFNKDLEAFKKYVTLVTTSPTLDYSFAGLAIPVRKLIGVTNRTDAQLFGTDESAVTPDYDYGLGRDFSDPRTENMPGIIDPFGQTWTFIEDPGTTTTTYRWIYYRNPIDLTGETDNTNLIIPEQYHLDLVQATSKICDFFSYQESFTNKDIEPYFKRFWEDMQEHYSPIGKGGIGFNESNLP